VPEARRGIGGLVDAKPTPSSWPCNLGDWAVPIVLQIRDTN